MIKAKGTLEDGSPFILLGISRLNVEKLQEGKPMLVDLTQLGLEGQIAIIYGETEDELAADLEKQFSIGVKTDDR